MTTAQPYLRRFAGKVYLDAPTVAQQTAHLLRKSIDITAIVALTRTVLLLVLFFMEVAFHCPSGSQPYTCT